MTNNRINYHEKDNTVKTSEDMSWYFYPGDIDGIRVMVAVRIFDLKSAVEKCKGDKDSIACVYHCASCAYNRFIFDDKIAYGSVCAYVECTPEQATEKNDYSNGGYTYCSFDEETQEYKDYRFEFPDGTKATEDKVIVGWDYNHGWDKDSDKDDAESDIFRFCCKLFGKEIKNNITAYKPNEYW